MHSINQRKHPRVYSRQVEKEMENESTLTLSAACAIGILAFTFLNGVTLGCLMKRKKMK